VLPSLARCYRFKCKVIISYYITTCVCFVFTDNLQVILLVVIYG